MMAKQHVFKNTDTAVILVAEGLKVMRENWENEVYISLLSLDGVCDAVRGSHEVAKGKWEECLERSQAISYEEGEVSALANLAQYYKNIGDYESSLKYVKMSIPYYSEEGREGGLANLYNTLCTVYLQLGDFDNSVKYGKMGLELRLELGDPSLINASRSSLGNVYKDQGRYKEALDQYFKGYNEVLVNDDIGGECACLNNIGLVYKNLEQYDLALKYYGQSVEACNAGNNPKLSALGIMNSGVVYQALDNPTQALSEFEKALVSFSELGDQSSVARCYSNIGSAHWDLGARDKAMDYMTKALEISRELNIPVMEARTLQNLGQFARQMGDMARSLDYGMQAFDKAKGLGEAQLHKEIYELLFRTYRDLGNYEQALEMHEEFVKYKDSLTNDENKSMALRREARHEYEVKAAQDSILKVEENKVYEARLDAQQADKRRLELESERKDTEKRRQDQQTAGIGIGLGLTLILALLAFRGYRNKQKANKVISQQKEELEGQKSAVEKQRALVEEKNNEILDSIQYAKRLQEAILPNMETLRSWLPEFFLLYQPKDIVAGDFYWSEKIGETVFIAAADCTGHGVPGALVSVVCSNALNKAVIEEGIMDPGQVLDRVTELVTRRFDKSEAEIKDGMDIAFCSWNEKSGQVRYAGANNPLWIIRRESAVLEEIKATKQPVGKYASIKPFESHTIDLSEGDTVFMFTDGFPDQFGGPRGKKYKYANFKKLLLGSSQEPMHSLRDLISLEFENWKGSLEQIDDVCIIGFRV